MAFYNVLNTAVAISTVMPMILSSRIIVYFPISFVEKVDLWRRSEGNFHKITKDRLSSNP